MVLFMERLYPVLEKFPVDVGKEQDGENLEELGLISLEEIREARRRVRSLLEFDRIQVEIAV